VLSQYARKGGSEQSDLTLRGSEIVMPVLGCARKPVPRQRLKPPAWAPFLLALALCLAHAEAEDLASAAISNEGTISGVQGETPLPVSPSAQLELLLAAYAHVRGCYLGAEASFGAVYANPRTEGNLLQLMAGIAHTCPQASPDLGHASGCGPEVRFFGLATLAALPLFMLDLAGCCAPPSPVLLEILANAGGAAAPAAVTELSDGLGANAALLLHLSNLVRGTVEAVAEGASGERVSLKLDDMSSGRRVAFLELRMHALLEASLSPHMESCLAGADGPPNTEARWPFLRWATL
jgi:hypothetical protein